MECCDCIASTQGAVAIHSAGWSDVMNEKVSWVQAKVNDPKIAKLITKLANSKKAIETGGCGCGCGGD